MNWRRQIAAGFSLALAAQVFAATSDRTKVAEISADRVHIDQQKQTSRYTGNVEFTQGSVHIAGDEVVLAASDGELQILDIRGNPATYREIDDAGQQLRARAQEILYDTASGLITLQGDAHLCRGGEYFRSVFIEYNTLTRAVNAGKKGATEQERVRITLRPGNSPQAAAVDCDEMP